MNLNGVQTAPDHFLGDYPACKWRKIQPAIPVDLRGKTVLDIGCNGGFYSIEMKKRGASRVVAIDSDSRYLKQAEFAAEVLDVEIEFRQMDVYDVADLQQEFDLVLFMGVLYHLRHPLLALDLLYKYVVRDKLVFQSLRRGSSHVASLDENYSFNETAIFQSDGYPLMYFVENCYADDPTNWWIPNRACVEAMLRSSGFSILDRPEDEVYICTRRPFHD
jgi:tRNA (mo5U34)-methyltransferase